MLFKLHHLLPLFSFTSASFLSGSCQPRIKTVSRVEGKLQSFTVGTDGKVYSQRFTVGSPNFSKWKEISDVEFPPCAPINAIARNGTYIDLFITGKDGKILTASKAVNSQWSDWHHVSGGLAQAGAYVEVVSRGEGLLDLFVVGTDDSVWTAAWEYGKDDDFKYRGWWKVGKDLDKGVPAGAEIGAVSKNDGQLDIFVTGKDKKIYSAHWSGGDWQGFWHINGGLAEPGAPVSVISKKKDTLDAFVVGTDGKLWTAFYHPDTHWQGWWKVLPVDDLHSFWD
ncbi:fucose-specific lectin [Ascobolus immersus RN42]|uniref:Fucose-specific lectin n=1 Tax=Ascobolus immersus RN42 TaxID=1160509 RepID=A0A3N4HZW5_ASCIM|nr:fucose-specific lectin [Ascobolus immersus RN42]